MSHCARDIDALHSGGCSLSNRARSRTGLPPSSQRAQRRYARHRPEQTLLYKVVEQYADAFFAHLSERDATLPGFVRDEFEAYLRCGRLEHGFLRVKCNQCCHEHLVAFSCKCRGFCPSCSARRMVETAAHLVDHVFPRVPVRQWVLSFPWPLRLLFAARPEVLTRVLNVVTRAVSSAVLKRAGLSRSAGAETGIVTFIQRFGSALNLNIHLHMLVLDGAYTFTHDRARFHHAPAPSDAELVRLLDTLIRRITRTLVRAGVLVEDPEQPWLDLEPGSTLEHLAAAAVAGGLRAQTPLPRRHRSRAVRATRLHRSPRCPGATPAHPLGAIPWIVRAKFETSPPHCRQPILGY